ncbi:Type II secretory pathway, ATPase PulE/Tfp pilus assembly pathway, ATPase PilB [Dissulfuribacter thermophilus]|uniref:Type II secretory pathway, ATPase PulE/Tfp pilus assembly pathway, ATPase PilB n=1 Tax=Dissulfuribacter thermophilus TaxID=1156395 RepID=A0A1B9F5H5_9BACT|nr:GspE/PulE family protein [Dissulfuribacter thermophilus]OCC15162.1 Type II secretory pathway, ATPase PulE/Tfp pilus assembly pathway, ATPase PilB [Dissulfuribacter thermophilus]
MKYKDLYKREKKINEITISLNQAENLMEIMSHLKDQLLEVFDCERITVYAVDVATKELFSYFKTGRTPDEIRVPLNKMSIAGYVATTGKIINIKDVYQNNYQIDYPGLHFDASWDLESGFRTRSVLAAPLVIKEKYLQGVVQLLNKRSHLGFSDEDVNLLKHISKGLAVAIYNQKRIHRKINKFDYLLQKNIISCDELNRAIALARSNTDAIKKDVSYVLLHEFGVDKSELGKALSRFYDTEFIEFSDQIIISSELLQGLNVKYLKKRFWIPLKKEGKTVTVLVDDPFDLEKRNEIRCAGLGRDIKLVVGIREDILRFIECSAGDVPSFERSSIDSFLEEMDEGGIEFESDNTPSEEDLLNEDAPAVVKLVTRIIKDAYDQGVSDIHIEPYPGKMPTEVRFRRDGVCYKYLDIPSTHTRAVVNRIKIMSNLDISEKRLPQSGKIKLRYGSKDIELRVEITPTVCGLEDAVMRILSAGKPIPLEKMNFSPRNLEKLLNIIQKPYGIILVVGPTGSGKTTTLHSILGHLNKPEKKIWTAEDPVEITQHGLRQVQVKPQIGYTFAAAMRSFLRGDPDIIMVGEMRDEETAHIALEASLTGHLVLSTLHTNSAPETITRLLDMGVNTLNFADAILGILAQRLVRTLCPSCKRPYHPTKEEFALIKAEYGHDYFDELDISYDDDFRLMGAGGCPKCNNTGYRGRIAIHELLVGSREIKRLIVEKAPVERLLEQGIKEGMRTLKQDGIYKIIQGYTDMVNVRKVCLV